MNPKYEKILTPFIMLFMMAEFIISAYLSYVLFGLWITIGAAFVMFLLTGLSVGIVTKLYEQPDSEKSLLVQQKAAFSAFYRVLPIIVFFPIRAVIIYFLYIEFENGVLFVLLYLLLIIQKNQAALDVTSSLADETFHKLNDLSNKVK